ncbi:MAG: ATP-binding cassette domain-containing protein [Clostridium sp.]|uniref:ATP-binding cassette domain-containing protein n=1 Tax=Clostridium sp. TaxID=1506 RepID=UPI002A916C91|nr:ATP-binding cassette domain-containing protein [Clostridium sp.]MDY6227662.1 ATP-binding cassette domain-containing protein [Clostridium sp.]
MKDLLNGFIIIKSFKAEKEVLLTFEKGKSYAVVGSSGSGKSTLLRLLLGFFKNYEGIVYVDNNNLKDISLDSLYDVVSVIQQNVFLFNRSIKDNITMFKEFNINKVERAINISGLSNLISDKGLDYKCGEEGSNLSGGEKQRISIARCLLRETPILLMDEATAALDNQIAFQVENDILSISGLTRIIVTYKLEETLLDKYDEIVVLKEGQVEEKGTFKELMELRGYFYSLYNVTKLA